MLIFFWLLFVLTILFLLNFALYVGEQFPYLSKQDEQPELPIRVRKQDPLTGMTILSPSEEKWLAKEKTRQDQEWNDFLERKEREAPLIFEKIYKNGINGRRVIEIGDLCWENYLSGISLLFAVRYEDDFTIGIISYDGINFKPVVGGKFVETIRHLIDLPRLELDEGEVNIHFEPEHYFIAQHNYIVQGQPPYWEWSIGGEGWGGGWAIKKFGEHGIAFDISGED